VTARPAMSLESLATYYRGVFFATVALKGRLASLGPELRPAVREVTQYQAMVKHFVDALEKTVEMREARS